nr:hypothetical protein [uncultured Desulfobacter sp.]
MEKYKMDPVLLKVATLACFILAGLTLMPWPYARDISVLDYRALCPFSPISTGLMCYAGIMVNGHRRRVQ